MGSLFEMNHILEVACGVGIGPMAKGEELLFTLILKTIALQRLALSDGLDGR